MKKLISSCITFIAIIIIANYVAASSYKMEIKSNTQETKKGETITINVELTDYKDIKNGLQAYQGQIEYDTNIFEKIEPDQIELKNGWTSLQYNEENNAFVAIHKTGSLENEIISISLKVKENAKVGETTIKVKGFVASEGKEDINTDESETKINMITVINDSILGILFIVPECIIILVGSMEISERTLSLGGLLLFIQYSGELFLPFTVIYETSFEFSSVVPAINRVKDFLENTNEKRCILRNSDSIVGKIDIKDMKFSYDQQEILSGINMSFEPGIVYALYGESGSGKSTICKILLKLWRINQKSVFLDGHDINEYDKYLLRKNITYISQDIILLDDTIYNNIVLDRKYISNKRFNEVVIKVGLKEFIEQLPYKEHTRLENQGEKISGGQKQRIALARAIVRESAVIILDEPTSALDSQNGEKIIDNMIKEFTKSTFIIISHADSIIEKCDIVYKIKDRKVIQVKK